MCREIFNRCNNIGLKKTALVQIHYSMSNCFLGVGKGCFLRKARQPMVFKDHDWF